MGMYFFKAKVQEPSDKLSYRNGGLVAADSLVDAMKKIMEDFCDEDNIIEISIEPFADLMTLDELNEALPKDYYRERHWLDFKAPDLTL